MTTGDRIKKRRNELGMTQEELAKKLGLQKSAIAKYEKGRVINIKHSTISNMAKIFHCTPAYLMGWNEEYTDTQETLDDQLFDLIADRDAQQEKIYELMKNCFDNNDICVLQQYRNLSNNCKIMLLQYLNRLYQQAANEEAELRNENEDGWSVKRTAYTCVCLTPEMHGSVTVWEEQEDAWRDAKERAEDLVQENPSVLKCKKVYDGYEVLDRTTNTAIRLYKVFEAQELE